MRLGQGFLLPRLAGAGLAAALLCLLFWGGVSARAAVTPLVQVVVIGIDGLSPDGVQKARTPELDRMMRQGAYTLHARGVLPTSSSPNWASMIMGAGPEQHGVTSNDWEPDKHELPPIATGPGGIFPTIFGVLREQRPHAVLACFHDWSGFGRLVERRALNVIEHVAGPSNTVRRAVQYFRERQPQFTFIHLDHVDHAGHQHGHGSPEYYAAVEEADRYVAQVVEGLRAVGMLPNTYVLVTSDHGGVGTGHGGATLAEIEIPWILTGPGVAAGREIQTPVNTYDTAATIAFIFGLKPPAVWLGRPVYEAFDPRALRR